MPVVLHFLFLWLSIVGPLSNGDVVFIRTFLVYCLINVFSNLVYLSDVVSISPLISCFLFLSEILSSLVLFANNLFYGN